MDQLQVFLKIEQPEKILNFPSHAALIGSGAPLTIGQFYMMLRQQIGFLQESDFLSTPHNQVDGNTINNALLVTNVKSAQAAIDLIVVQGEGTPESPLEADGGNPAHYYRFNQIAKGALLRPNPTAGPDTPPDERYIYDGNAVTLLPAGVFAAPSDPKSANYPAGSAARAAMDRFNQHYRDLLQLLQIGFSGDATALSTAVDKMPDLRAEGRALMATQPDGSGPLGPSFEYT
jgi:hypothetical protein